MIQNELSVKLLSLLFHQLLQFWPNFFMKLAKKNKICLADEKLRFKHSRWFRKYDFLSNAKSVIKKWEKVALQSPPPTSALAIGFVTLAKMEHGCGHHQFERPRPKETKMKIKQKKTNWNYRQSSSLEAEKIIELKDGKESTYSGTLSN